MVATKSQGRSSENESVIGPIVKFIFFALVLIGGPYIVVHFFNIYEEKASGLVEQKADQIARFSEETGNGTSFDSSNGGEILTKEQKNTIGRIKSFISGEWYSAQDGRYKLYIDVNGEFAEYYDDEKEGFGTWKVYPRSESYPFQGTSTLESDDVLKTLYLFEKMQYESGHKGEIYTYEIQYLDEARMTLMYRAGNGKSLVFVKK